jgi:electron transport complex protein RnfA
LILIGLPAGQLLQQYLLAPLQLQALRLFLLLPLLATLAWGLPQLLRRMRPGWPVEGLQGLLLGNVAVLGLLLQLGMRSGVWQALAWGVIGGLGFWLALLLFADLRAAAMRMCRRPAWPCPSN